MISGHHIEYIKHLYDMAFNDAENKYIFAVQKEYNLVEDTIEWHPANNIKFDHVDKDVNKSYLRKNISIFKKILRNKPDTIIMVNIMDLFPFMPSIIHALGIKTTFSGILYDIYLYKWKASSLLHKVKYIFFYKILKMQKHIKRVWVLNDKASCRVLNTRWKTDKFVFLPDPIPLDITSNSEDRMITRKECTNFLHCGSMSERKGTICLLDAIKLIDCDKGKRRYFFLGKVNLDIHDLFYKKTKDLSKDHDIIIQDGFCDFEVLKEHIKKSDYIVLPYKETAKSSGIIGYAALFNKHVVVPRTGLIKRLVRSYMLGTTLENVRPQTIANFITNSTAIKHRVNGEAYVKNHRVIDFNNTINLICH